MSDIRFDNDLRANTNVDTEYADASATAGHDGSLAAGESGASYAGSLDGRADYSTQLPDAPELPDAPALPDAAADATATVGATADQMSARADAAVHGATGAELPELPDVEAPEVPDAHGSLDVSATIDAWVDAMGDLAAHVSGAVSAMLGL